MKWISATRRTIAVMVLCVGFPLAGNTGPQTLTLEDVLKVADIGSVVTDPAGQWLIYEQQRPYDQNSDYSFRTYAMGKSGHQIWRVGLGTDAAPQLLPGLDPEPHSYLDSFSPAGRYLAVMQYSRGRLTLGAYDLWADKFSIFEGVPAYSRTGAHNPVWISEDEILYAALPPGKLPDETSVRVRAADQFYEGAAAAWRGDTVTAIEVPGEAAYDGALILANARTGETRDLAHGLFADLRLSPDGAFLAALKVEAGRRAAPGKSSYGAQPFHRLIVFELASGDVLYASEVLDTYPYTLAWSGDSRRVAGFSWPDGAGPEQGRFHVLELQSGAVTPFPHYGLDLASERERGWLQRPERVHFLGDNLAVFARAAVSGEAATFEPKDTRPQGLGRADWYALSRRGDYQNLTAGLQNVSPIPVQGDHESLTILADGGVYRLRADGAPETVYTAPSGRLQLLRSGTFATRASVARPEFNGRAVVVGSESGREKVALLDFTAEGGVTQTDILLSEHSGAPVAADFTHTMVFLRKEVAGVVDFSSVSRVRETRNLVRLNDHLAGLELGAWKALPYNYQTPGGGVETLSSCILLPPDFDPHKPPPVIVDVYPNITSACPAAPRGLAFPDPVSPYVWAAKGYAYVRPATPRALIRGEAGPLAGLPSVLSAAISAAAGEGVIDPEKVVLHGFSQGAVSALYTAARPGTYRAVIARNGWADLFSHYFGPVGVYAYTGDRFGEFGRYDRAVGSDFNFGRTPFEDPEVYYRNSPVFLAEGINAPVLLVHSDLDSFSAHQFDEMYGALIRAGKDARYVRYVGEGHGPSSPANISDLWRRMETFLENTGAAPAD